MRTIHAASTTARRTALAGIGLAIAASGFIGPATADASTARNGACESGEFCLSYNSNLSGSISDFAAGTNISNFGDSQPNCYDFKSGGNGRGLCVKNHAAAARNLTSYYVTLYVNSGYGGDTQTIAPGQTVNLIPALKNNEAAMKSVYINPCLRGLVYPRPCAQAVGSR